MSSTEELSDHCAVCAHVRADHIYYEGACRPGFVCNCEEFVAERLPEPIDAIRAGAISDALRTGTGWLKLTHKGNGVIEIARVPPDQVVEPSDD